MALVAALLFAGTTNAGPALEDVWLTYPDKGPSRDRSIGTSIQFFDPQSALWRVVWVHPSTGVLISLTGGAVGDRIVLRGTPGDGSELRGSSNDILPDSFVWRGEVSRDGGKAWRLRNEQWMKRRVVRHDCRENPMLLLVASTAAAFVPDRAGVVASRRRC